MLFSRNLSRDGKIFYVNLFGVILKQNNLFLYISSSYTLKSECFADFIQKLPSSTVISDLLYFFKDAKVSLNSVSLLVKQHFFAAGITVSDSTFCKSREMIRVVLLLRIDASDLHFFCFSWDLYSS